MVGANQRVPLQQRTHYETITTVRQLKLIKRTRANPPISAPSMRGNEKQFNAYILFKGYGDVEDEGKGWEGRGKLAGDP